MFQNYLCVISDNIRVNDNIFQPGFQNMLSLTIIIIRNQTNVGCNGSVLVSVLLALTASADIVLGNIFGHDFPKCIIMVRNQTNEERDGSAIGFGDFRT